MNKLKLFIENFLVYGLSGIISKIIPLVMVPIVTRMMPDSSYYGISDLAHTVVSFGSAFAIMGMYDAMYRMFFENDKIEYQKEICSTTLIFTVLTSISAAVLLLLFKNQIAVFVLGNESYQYLVYIIAATVLVSATNSIVSAPTRMQNKRKIYLIMNTVTPIISYSVAIPMLVHKQYMIALPLAVFISGISAEFVFFILNKQWFHVNKFRWCHLKYMVPLAIPLLFETLTYWVFSSCDRIMISNILGVRANGIYAVGSKLGYASQLIYTAFAGGWQFFAFSTMNEDNQVKSNSKIFEYLGIISFVSAMWIFVVSEPIYKLLFRGDYVQGFIVAPYLYLSPLLLMLYQVAGNQLLVIKKTWPSILIISAGAIINIVLNRHLIPAMGIEGAAISTLVGYLTALIICVIALLYMKLMVISKRFIIAACGMSGFVFVWHFLDNKHCFLIILLAVMLNILYMWLYKNDITSLGILSNKVEKIRTRK